MRLLTVLLIVLALLPLSDALKCWQKVEVAGVITTNKTASTCPGGVSYCMSTETHSKSGDSKFWGCEPEESFVVEQFEKANLKPDVIKKAVKAGRCHSETCKTATNPMGGTATICCCKGDLCDPTKSPISAANPAATPTLFLLPLAAVAAMIAARI